MKKNRFISRVTATNRKSKLINKKYTDIVSNYEKCKANKER